MGLESRIKSGLRNLTKKRHAEAQLDDEVRAYVDMVTDEKIAAGLSPAEARRSTLAELGGVEQVKQAVREERSGAGIELLCRIFGTVCASYANPEVFLLCSPDAGAWHRDDSCDVQRGGCRCSAAAALQRPSPNCRREDLFRLDFVQMSSWPRYLEMRRQNATFQDLAGYAPYWGMTLRLGDQAQYVHVTQGTDNFFHVFGVNPILGRAFCRARTAQERTILSCSATRSGAARSMAVAALSAQPSISTGSRIRSSE